MQKENKNNDFIQHVLLFCDSLRLAFVIGQRHVCGAADAGASFLT